MINVPLLIIAAYWKFFAVANNVANDFSYLSQAELLSRFALPQVWQERISEGFGQYALSILWNWPLDFLYGLLGKVGFSFSSIEIILFLIPFIFVGHYSIKKFLNYFDLKGGAEAVGILFYLINPYVILLIDGGQLSIALAYVFLPVAFVYFFNSLNKGVSSKLRNGLSLSVLGFLDIRYLYLLAILILLQVVFLVFEDKRKLKKLLGDIFSTIFVSLIVFLALNFYWLLPSVIARAPSLPAGYSDLSQVNNLSFTDWKHALLFQPAGWYKNVFGNISAINKAFLVIPLLVFSGFLAGFKRKKVWFAVGLTVLGLFLVKGATEPFSGVYKFLFEYVPGFSLFRDSTKFYIFIALGYSYFLSLLVLAANGFSKTSKKLHEYIPRGLIIIYLLLLIIPVWLGQMTGILSNPIHEETYKELWSTLERDANFGRVLWLPAQPPLGYSSPTHPSIETSRIFTKRPFATGVVGSYETNNFLREAKYMGDVFNIYGIKYIAYPYSDERRTELKQDSIDYYYAFLDQLTNLPWIEKKVNDVPVALLETRNTTDRFFIAPNSFNVVGSDKILSELHEIKNFDLSKNVLSFSETYPYVDNNFSKIILYKKSFLDFVATRIPKNYFIFPSNYLEDSPNQTGWPASNALRSNTGWWKRDNLSFLWVRNFLQQKYSLDNADFDYGGGYAFSEGKNTLEINDQKINLDSILLARVLLSPEGGNVSFYQNNNLVGSVETRKELGKSDVKLTGYGDILDQAFSYDDTNFAWVKVGELKNGNQLGIRTDGEINVVNALVSIPKDIFDNISESLGHLSIIDFVNLSDDQKQLIFTLDNSTKPNVSYQRIAPTHYKVTVSGIQSSQTLVFSETYDNLWKLDSQASFPVYENLNGFVIDHDGTYDLYFSPQKYVNIGFVVSIVSLSGLLSYLLIKQKRN